MEETPGLPAKHDAVRQFLTMDSPLVSEVQGRIRSYLELGREASEATPVPWLSEYVGGQMLSPFSQVILQRFFKAVNSGEMNTQHGYDDDVISKAIEFDVKQELGFHDMAFTLSGTGANLAVLASLSRSFEESSPNDVKLVLCETEHTVSYESNMTEFAGIRDENILKLPSREQGDGLIEQEALSACSIRSATLSRLNAVNTPKSLMSSFPFPK